MIFRQRLLLNDKVVTKKPFSTNEVVYRRSDQAGGDDRYFKGVKIFDTTSRGSSAQGTLRSGLDDRHLDGWPGYRGLLHTPRR